MIGGGCYLAVNKDVLYDLLLPGIHIP